MAGMIWINWLMATMSKTRMAKVVQVIIGMAIEITMAVGMARAIARVNCLPGDLDAGDV